jgi:hypothetical protein
MKQALDFRPGLLRSSLLFPGFCLALAAFWLMPSAARADVGSGESELFILDTDRCAQSEVFAIDNGNCVESAVFAIDTRRASADFDHDGDVDGDDLAVFQASVSGPDVVCSDNSAKADFDHDGDVDQADFGMFLWCVSGSGNLADPNCMSQPPWFQHHPLPALPPEGQKF